MCAAGLAVAAVVMWLLGKAVRFVLTGPAKEAQPAPQKHSSPAVAHRTTSVPLTGPPRRQGPWEPPSLPMTVANQAKPASASNDLSSVARSVVETQYVSDAERLIRILGGRIHRGQRRLLTGAPVTVHLDGRSHTFKGEYLMTQSVVAELAPRYASVSSRN
jgi:hypothetical protein